MVVNVDVSKFVVNSVEDLAEPVATVEDTVVEMTDVVNPCSVTRTDTVTDDDLAGIPESSTITSKTISPTFARLSFTSISPVGLT